MSGLADLDGVGAGERVEPGAFADVGVTPRTVVASVGTLAKGDSKAVPLLPHPGGLGTGVLTVRAHQA